MARALVILSCLALVGTAAHAEAVALPGGGCLSCHAESPVAEVWKDDVHAKVGLGCVTCHGGNPDTDDMDEAKAPKTGFLGAPKRADIPKLCAKCHSDAVFMKKYSPLLPVDQLDKYLTSVHGQLLQKGDPNVAECANCHGAHGIRKVSDPKSPVYASNLPKMCAVCHADKKRMASYGIPTTQYEEYLGSVHGEALLKKGDVRGAPACNDCHGNHGATPPGANTVAHVCAICHARNAELFLASPMAKPLSKEPFGECIACHGKHRITHTSDVLVTDQPGAVCMKCHKTGEKGTQFAHFVAEALSGYRQEQSRVARIIEEGEQKGMDVTEGKDLLQAAQQSLIQARTELHAFAKPPMEKKLNEGRQNLQKAELLGMGALKEHKTRRIGLAVSSLLLTLFALFLALKIRSLS